MIDKDQVVRIKAKFTGPADKTLDQFFADLGRSRQQPQVRPVITGYKRVLIAIVIEVEYYVGTVEWTEERDFQVARVFRSDKIGFAFSLLPFVVFAGKTAVDDCQAAVVAQRILGGDAVEAAFERMIKACDFVPGAQVPVAVKPGHRLNALRQPGAGV